MYAKADIIGYLGSAPELRKSDNEVSYMILSIGVQSAGKEKMTTWFRTMIFGKIAIRLSEMLQKGDLVFASGTLNVSTYNDKIEVSINANTIRILKHKNDDRIKHEEESMMEFPPKSRIEDDLYA